MKTTAFCGAAALLVSAAAFAQNAALFPQPIVSFAGRYLDSTSVFDFQFPNRTLRAEWVKVAPELDRIFMILGGGTFAAYHPSTFVSRLGTPLATGAHGEKFLAPDMRVDPEAPGSGWTTVMADGQQRLFDFDWDDRGSIYIAAQIWGWGVVDLNGHLIKQTPTDSTYAVISLKVNGKYYLAVSDGSSSTKVYDVSDATNPLFVRTLPTVFTTWAKTSSAVALLNSGARLVIGDPATLVSGGALSVLPPPPSSSWSSVTTDGIDFYATANGAGTFSVVKITSAGTTTVVDSGAPGFAAQIGAGAGYVVVHGQAGGSRVVNFYKIASLPTARMDASPFFNTYPSTLVSMLPAPATIFGNDGIAYMIGPYSGLGDVYQLASALPSADVTVHINAAIATGVSSPTQTTLTVTNGGPATATSVRVTNAVTPSVTFTAAGNPFWICSSASGALTCVAPLLSPGTALTLPVTFTAPTAIGTLQDSAIVDIDNPDANVANNMSSVAIAVFSPATLTGAQSVAGTATLGGTVTYTVVITNTGPATQLDNPGDEFTDLFPAAFTFTSANASSGTATLSGSTVHWNGSIAATASVTLTINAKLTGVPAQVPISNQPTLSFDANGDGTNETALPIAPATLAFDVASIPTLSPATLVLLAAMLAFVGFFAVQRPS